MAEPQFLTVSEAAARMRVSETWVRRHLAELPVVRQGKLIRIDSGLLSEQMQATLADGNSLKERKQVMNPHPYQRGNVRLRGKKKVWWGMYREDVRDNAGINTVRRQVRLGTVAELPTKHAARNRLSDLLSEKSEQPIKTEMTLTELAQRWRKAEGPSMKISTFNHYSYALQAYIEPVFGTRQIDSINREDIQKHLLKQAETYSKSVLRSMKVSAGIVFGWAVACGYLEKNPCIAIKLPLKTGGRTVSRTVLTPEKVEAVAMRLEEPYSTLVLCLYGTGLRISEAIAIRDTDLDQNDVLSVERRVYERTEDGLKSKKSRRKLPLAASLARRMRDLCANRSLVFASRAGTSVDPKNALNRYVRPAVEAEGLKIGGWHDFRHTISTDLRRDGVHPKIVSDILGHAKVNLAMDTYDRTEVAELVGPLVARSQQVVPNGAKSAGAA